PRFAVSDVELRRRGTSYTVDTLRALGREGELFLLLGSETFLDLLSWKDPRQVTALARPVVVARGGHAFDPESTAAQQLLKELGLPPFVGGPGPGRGPILTAATSLPISGSDLRRRALEGRSLHYRMPEAVIAYIAAHGLYRGAGA